MKVISLISSKGGVGKSTIALNVAVAANSEDLFVAVIDSDPQRSLSDWRKVRGKVGRGVNPDVVPIVAERIPSAIDTARRGGLDLVIIDTQGRAGGPELATAIEVSDLILIPVGVGGFDIMASRKTLQVLGSHDALGKSVAMLSAAPGSAKEEARARSDLVKLGLDVLDAKTTNRAIYRQSVGDGSSAVEVDPGGKAAEEIMALWSEIKGRIGGE
ncbi:MAG: ParA family protein [Hyphomicrobiaceae bacterium]